MLDDEEDIAEGFSTVVVEPRGLWEPPVVVSPESTIPGRTCSTSPVDFDGKPKLNGAIHHRHTSIATGDHGSTFERGMGERA